MNCPLCHAHEATVVYSVSQAPVTCTAVFDSPEEARAVPLGRIELAICAHCGFAYNRVFDVGLARIGAELDVAYESSQSASGRFSQFARGLVAEWVERFNLRGKTVIEVGSGGGAFLSELVHAGVGKVIAIDPVTPQQSGTSAIHVVNETFDARHIDIQADALVCRHMLEHEPKAGEFLRAVHEWAVRQPGRVVLFELPSAERVRDEAAFWDIYYEHCNYFTGGTLRRAFEQAGFQLLRLDLAYDGQYFLVEAKPQRIPTETQPAMSHEVASWVDFGARAQEAIQNCRRMLNRFVDEGGPVVVWQGASKTIGVLTAIDMGQGIECAVDLSPGRQGRYLPGSGLAVRAPGVLPSLQPRHIVLMNPIYRAEVQQQLDQMGVRSNLWTVNNLIEREGHAQTVYLCESPSKR